MHDDGSAHVGQVDWTPGGGREGARGSHGYCSRDHRRRAYGSALWRRTLMHVLGALLRFGLQTRGRLNGL